MIGGRLDAPSTQGRSSGEFSAILLLMKNFVRLVRFAWPHRIRFVLSIACAAMVALFYFTELAAVLPLLNILFKSENPQCWISKRVDNIGEQIIVLNAQAEEAQKVIHAAELGDLQAPELAKEYQRLDDQSDAIREELKVRQRAVDLPDLKGLSPEFIKKELAEIDVKQKQLDIVEGRLSELRRGSAWLKANDAASIRYRLAQIDKARDSEQWWLARYQRIKPFIYKYLPSDPFRNLLLLIGMVILGVAIKGFFMFLQEVLVADVMQRTQFDIRNLFFRRTINLDLGSFSDQGSAELMARFTNDMDSFGQGLVTLLSKLIREPMRVGMCLSGALYLNWRLTCLTLVVVPISALTTVPCRQDHEARHEALAGKHVVDLQDPPGKLPGDQGGQGLRHGTRRAQAILHRDQELLPQGDPGGDDRRHVRPGPGNADPGDGGHRALGRLVSGPQEDHLSPAWPVADPARVPDHGHRGAAHPLRRARRSIRPDPQALQRSLQDPAPRRQPTASAP